MNSRCGDSLNHGVLLVGIGREDSTYFLKVKNSWSESWGENGYIRMGFDRYNKNPCGIVNEMDVQPEI